MPEALARRILILAARLCPHLALFRCRSKGTNVKLLKPTQAPRTTLQPNVCHVIDRSETRGTENEQMSWDCRSHYRTSGYVVTS